MTATAMWVCVFRTSGARLIRRLGRPVALRTLADRLVCRTCGLLALPPLQRRTLRIWHGRVSHYEGHTQYMCTRHPLHSLIFILSSSSFMQ
ncbi:hypothetical protein C8Q72DRAFT_821121 [Fomitopsis betulina]|nr:hypothetical protein C8Q72DRAFT_821121 [Fomitopsis betulina]